jgi:hypothetical protein
MKGQKEVKEEKISNAKTSLERIVVLVALALLIGLLAGILSHDHLARFNPGHSTWKNLSVH